jgi:hypothetical protein
MLGSYAGCSETIARPARHSATCSSTLLSVCPTDCTLALVALKYPPPAQQASKPLARGRAPALTDTFLVSCDGEAISLCHVTAAALAHETPTAAAWASDQELLIGTASGLALSLACKPAVRGAGAMSTLSGGSSSRKLQQPTVARALGLHLYNGRICGAAVLGQGAAADGEQARRCVLLATPSALFCLPGSGSLRKALEPFDSATAISIGLAIELDDGANPFPQARVSVQSHATGCWCWLA